MRSGICWPHVGREPLALDYCPAAMGRRNSNALAPHGFTKIPPTCSDILMKSVLVVDAVILSIRTKAIAGNLRSLHAIRVLFRRSTWRPFRARLRAVAIPGVKNPGLSPIAPSGHKAL